MKDGSEEGAALPLFRPEAVEARQVSPLGNLVVIRSHLGAVASACGVLFLIAIVAALALGSYVDKVRLTGTVVADRGVVRLEGSHGSIVEQIRVAEGQAVREGQILFVLGAAEEAASGPSAQTLLSSLRDRRARLRLELDEAIEQRSANEALATENIKQRQHQLSVLEAETVILRQRIAATSASRDRYQTLRTRGFTTLTTLDAVEDHLAELQLRLSSVDQDRSRLQSEIAQFVHDRAQSPRLSLQERNNLLRDISQVDSEIASVEAQQARVVRAPVSGIVASLEITRGQAVPANGPIASILPAGSRMEVDLRAPTAAVGRLVEGQPVWLQFDAFPYQRYGQFQGVVRTVARTAAREGEGDWQYRVRVRLEGRLPSGLKPDMSVAATIAVGRRRLLEILFPRSVA